MPAFKNRAIVLEINARVIDGDGDLSWESKQENITIPGRPVSLRLVGDNLVIDLRFTLYYRQRRDGKDDGAERAGENERREAKTDAGDRGRKPDEKMPPPPPPRFQENAEGDMSGGFLVAQGQIWVQVPGVGMQYQSTMKTLPVVFGESVFFFPLGGNIEDGDSQIEIELCLNPYASGD
jgi:hypothetical protein